MGRGLETKRPDAALSNARRMTSQRSCASYGGYSAHPAHGVTCMSCSASVRRMAQQSHTIDGYQRCGPLRWAKPEVAVPRKRARLDL